MISFFICLGLFHAALSAVLLIRGKKLHAVKEKSSLSKAEKIELSQITVIIPFRNEEKNLIHLVNCILNSKKQPKEIIFVDDHSSDHGKEWLQKAIENYSFIQVISSLGEGKKAAIRTGIAQSKAIFILTLDADVLFERNYFTNLEQLPTSDLIILPVRMRGKGWRQLFEMDYLRSNYLNAAINGWKRPVLGSGANLLFRREAFLKLDSYKEHKKIASGDDAFLIRDFQMNDKEVLLIQNQLFEVETTTPETWNSFLHQRIRWIKKTPKVKDALANALGFFAALGILNYLLLLFFAFQAAPFYLPYLVICAYFLIDFILFSPVLFQSKNSFRWFWVSLYVLVSPLYQLTIGVLALFVAPAWKGRK